MSNQKDGGSAFPMQFLGINRGALSYEDTSNQEGMTLRDYFAAKALQGLLNGFEARLNQERIDNLTWRAFALSDAMLEARKQ